MHKWKVNPNKEQLDFFINFILSKRISNTHACFKYAEIPTQEENHLAIKKHIVIAIIYHYEHTGLIVRGRRVTKSDKTSGTIYNISEFIEVLKSKGHVIEPFELEETRLAKPTESNHSILQDVHKEIESMVAYLKELPKEIEERLLVTTRRLNATEPPEQVLSRLKHFEEEYQFSCLQVEELEKELLLEKEKNQSFQNRQNRKNKELLSVLEETLDLPGWEIRRKKKEIVSSINSTMNKEFVNLEFELEDAK